DHEERAEEDRGERDHLGREPPASRPKQSLEQVPPIIRWHSAPSGYARNRPCLRASFCGQVSPSDDPKQSGSALGTLRSPRITAARGCAMARSLWWSETALAAK